MKNLYLVCQLNKKYEAAKFESIVTPSIVGAELDQIQYVDTYENKQNKHVLSSIDLPSGKLRH